jgi:hypothetical protein
VNLLLCRPTRPCNRHAPQGWHLTFPPWVVGTVFFFLLTSLPQAQSLASGTHSLLGSRAFSGGASTPQGYNPALITPPSLSNATDNANGSIILSGLVWWDYNDSGIMDNSDFAIPGAVVDLYLPSEPNTAVASSLTNSVGQFFFSVGPGTYIVRNTTGSATGSSSSQVSSLQDSSSHTVTVKDGDTVTNLNFSESEFPPELISKRLFLSSSDPLQPVVPEPGVWLGLLSAGFAGAMYFLFRRNRSSASFANESSQP